MNEPCVDCLEVWNACEDERTPEAKLWRAAVARFVLDALDVTSIFNKATRTKAMTDAQYFFEGPASDYFTICALADVDAVSLRRVMVPMIREFRATGERPEAIAGMRRGRKAGLLDSYSCTAQSDRAPTATPPSPSQEAQNGH